MEIFEYLKETDTLAASVIGMTSILDDNMAGGGSGRPSMYISTRGTRGIYSRYL